MPWLTAIIRHRPPPAWQLGNEVLVAVDQLAEHLARHHESELNYRRQLAIQVLLYPDLEHPLSDLPGVARLADQLRAGLEEDGTEWRQAEARGRYAWIRKVAGGARAAAEAYRPSRSDRVDGVLTHPVWGLVVFIAVMGIVFQSIFSWAGPLMGGIEGVFGWLGALAGALLPAGPLQGLIVDGVIGGVGGVMVFLPQILMLFLFVAILEDVGYMSRAAFLMDRHMRRAGLHGRAFIPMLSGFACSIPGIMAARTIPDRRDKLATMLVVPLISCSARLPVYALVIGAFIPTTPVISGFRYFTYQGLILLSAYLFSIAAAITVAYIFRKTMLPGKSQPFLLELPSYRIPHWKSVLIAMWERGKLFITQAGTIILAINIILWFLLSFPANPVLDQDYDALRSTAQSTLQGEALEQQLVVINGDEAGEKLSLSYAGRAGHLLEPAIKPLGFDWKIGVALIGSLAAREVFVSTLSVIYGIGEDDSQAEISIMDRIQSEFSMLAGISILIFFILSCQCLATVAVMKRETNSWKWALFLYTYMTVLAYVASLVFYQVSTRIWPELA